MNFLSVMVVNRIPYNTRNCYHNLAESVIIKTMSSHRDEISHNRKSSSANLQCSNDCTHSLLLVDKDKTAIASAKPGFIL